MRYGLMFVVILVFITGCASMREMEEAYELDREFGRAQMESWDKMIAYPDSPYSDKIPEGLEGINAEPAMEVYQKSYSKAPTETNVIEFGLIGD